MRIIIDGYNLFKSVLGCSYISRKEHIQLLKQLIAYTCKKKHSIIIFFDSGPTFLKETIAPSELLEICYAGQGTSADQRIIEYVTASKERPLLMVSNDNELKKNVILQGVDTIKSLEFWYFIQRSSESHKPKITSLHKYSKNTHPELDALMQVTCVPTIESSNQYDKFTGGGLSKKDKKIALLRKKL